MAKERRREEDDCHERGKGGQINVKYNRSREGV